MPFIALRFALGQHAAEAVEAECFALGACAITFSDQRDDAVLEPLPGEMRLWPATRVEALFDGTADGARLQAALAERLQLPPSSVELAGVADKAWEREWLRDFHAMRFGRRLWICPQHEVVTEPGAVVVKLDPGLAFGTGTHPSTAMCLAWLDGQLRAGERVIDYGCGSGVLAIAATLLGASRAEVFDIDPQALLASADNAANNGVATQVTLCAQATQLQPGADVLLANILAPTLIELSGALAALVRPGGRIVLAGILQNQTLAVTAAYAACFDMRLTDQRDEWVLLAGTRKPC